MNIPISPQQLPSGFCPPTYQEMWNGFAAAGFVNLPDSAVPIVRQASKPTDPTVNWLQLDALGRPVRLYVFAQGAWLSYNNTVPGLTMWWFATLPDFTTFDGGDANPLSDISGPMWQQAKDSNENLIAATFPLPAGTLPSGTILSLGDKGGEENHTLTSKESFPHTHFIATIDQANNPSSDNAPSSVTSTDSIASSNNNGGGRPSQYSFAKGVTSPATIGITSSSGGDTTVTPPVAVGHNTLPLFVVGYLLQRTNRLFYSVN